MSRDAVAQDVRFALRHARASPLVTAIIVLLNFILFYQALFAGGLGGIDGQRGEVVP